MSDERSDKIARVVPGLDDPEMMFDSEITMEDVRRIVRSFVRTARRLSNSCDGELLVGDYLDYALFGGDFGCSWGLTFYKLAEAVAYPLGIEDVLNEPGE